MTRLRQTKQSPRPEAVAAEEARTAESTRSELTELPHFTPAERAARGKAARGEIPRSSHAGWEPAPLRRNPVELLEEQAQTRLPELIPIRYGRMLESPFAFYRGGAYLMAADLAAGPRTGLHAQLCGDAHLSNFGVFAAPDRRLVFSINDFDETLPGPFEWDVKRLAASFAVAGREFGFDEGDAACDGDGHRPGVPRGDGELRRRCGTSTSGTRASTWRAASPASAARVPRKKMRRLQTQDRAGAHEGQHARAREAVQPRSTVSSDSLVDPPLVTPIEDVLPGAEKEHLEDTIRHMIRTYSRSLPRDRRTLLESYRYVHAARKVVGVGSVGTRAWIVLLLGRDESDPLFLQFKEAQPSVLEPFLGQSEFDQHGQRVVEGQRMMQAASDIMLGWERVVTIDGETKDFYIRQLWDAKASAEIELMDAAGLGRTGGCAGGHSPGRTRVPGTGSRSPPTSGRATRSTGRWPRSPRRTRTRTSVTTRVAGRGRVWPGRRADRHLRAISYDSLG